MKKTLLTFALGALSILGFSQTGPGGGSGNSSSCDAGFANDENDPTIT